jgi:hypothetical protein
MNTPAWQVNDPLRWSPLQRTGGAGGGFIPNSIGVNVPTGEITQEGIGSGNTGTPSIGKEMKFSPFKMMRDMYGYNGMLDPMADGGGGGFGTGYGGNWQGGGGNGYSNYSQLPAWYLNLVNWNYRG